MFNTKVVRVRSRRIVGFLEMKQNAERLLMLSGMISFSRYPTQWFRVPLSCYKPSR